MRKFILYGKEIYVLCPAHLKTGGPELLHQLVYVLNSYGINAHIVYILDENDPNTNIFIIEEYQKYITSFYTEKDIIDDTENLIVIPETLFKYISKWEKIKQVMWWLSVDNFEKYNGFWGRYKYQGFLIAVYNLLRGRMQFPQKKVINVEYHLCQSYYAKKYLLNLGVNESKIEDLSDYINDEFVNKQNINKERIVIYNPKKGLQYTKKIIKKMPDVKWIKIEGLKTDAVHTLMQKSMVYVDFGNHPGKDRMPREAALSGCCIITGMRGAAKYFEDVSIPSKYKINEKKVNTKNVVKLIYDSLNNYEIYSEDFEEYCNLIKNKKKEFYTAVKELFMQGHT